MRAETDVPGLEPETGGDFRLGRRLGVEPLGQLRQLEIGGERLAPAMARAANNVADGFLEHDPEILGGEQIAGPPVGDQSRGSDRGMAGERQFALGRKDPHPRGVDRVPRLEDEHGLGQVELGGDRLHAGVVESIGVEHDGEGIASERRLGEHIERLKPARHQDESPAPAALLERAGGPRQYQENSGPSVPGQETIIRGRFDWGSETGFGRRSVPRTPTNVPWTVSRCGGLKVSLT